ncbi:MAG TPA: hypothetical protein VFB92_29775 [Vicinamibacterales bacterium]|jgi:hypothetical protein|nr:hypothetical protein [Vicinamibacterales bacterium]
MAKLPLFHERAAEEGRGGSPGWWFGAPIVAFLYAFLTPRLVPEIVPLPDLPNGVAPAMRWFIGLLLGVALLSGWRVFRWVRSTRPVVRS